MTQGSMDSMENHYTHDGKNDLKLDQAQETPDIELSCIR
jgi:hypothetical protein